MLVLYMYLYICLLPLLAYIAAIREVATDEVAWSVCLCVGHLVTLSTDRRYIIIKIYLSINLSNCEPCENR